MLSFLCRTCRVPTGFRIEGLNVKNTQNHQGLRRLIGGLCLLSVSALTILSVSGLATESAQAQQLAHIDQTAQNPAPVAAVAPRKPHKRIASAVATVPASAVTSSPADAKPTARNPTASARGPYYVDFRARTAASYGHAFVWYGRTSDRKVDVAGLHPKGDEAEYMLGHLTFVPADTGASYGDLDEQYLTANYRVYLSEPDAKRVFAYIHHLQATQKFWNAQTNNCTSFIGRIANFMGLKTPFHLVWPENYVKQMKEMNGNRTTVVLAARDAEGF